MSGQHLHAAVRASDPIHPERGIAAVALMNFVSSVKPL
jgi:hypothetical protein